MKFKIQYDVDATPLERLKNYGIRKAIRIANNRAARGLKEATTAAAEKVKLTGTLAKSQKIKVKLYGATGAKAVTIVGPGRNYTRKGATIKRGRKSKSPFRRGLKKTIRPGRYAHIVEGGSKRSKARPWKKPAEAAALPRFKAEVVAEIKREIDKELAAQGRG